MICVPGPHLRTARNTLLTDPLYASAAPRIARPAPAIMSWRLILRRGQRLASDTVSASSIQACAAHS